MTDVTPTAFHPDDERLSAVLDGEARLEDRAHAASCPRCADRLARFGAVAAAVAAPVGAPDPRARTRAIRAALAAVDEAPAPVVPLVRRPRAAAASRWLLAAAVLLLVALSVPAAIRFAGEGRGDDDDTAASAATTAMAADSAAGSAGTEPSGEVRDAGDLGPIGADSDLPAQLGLTSDRSTDQGEAAAPPTTAAGGVGDGAPPTIESLAATCEAAVRADDPQLGPLLVMARGQFDGEPVEVLGFRAGDDARVYALAVGTCELRTVQTAR